MPTEAADQALRAPQLVCVDPARVPQIWPHVAHLVRGAMERGGTGDFGAVEQNLKRRGAPDHANSVRLFSALELSLAGEPQFSQSVHSMHSGAVCGSVFLHGDGRVGLLRFAALEDRLRAGAGGIVIF